MPDHFAASPVEKTGEAIPEPTPLSSGEAPHHASPRADRREDPLPATVGFVLEVSAGVSAAATLSPAMPIVLFQHSDAGKPGRLGLTLRDHGYRVDIRRLDRGDSPPPDYDDVQAVVAMGGPQTVAVEAETPDYLEREMEYLRGAHERRLPIIGVCLGAQMLARALGGEVGRMEKPEVGFHELSIASAGQTDTILSGLAWRSPQLCLHEDEIKTLPPESAGLAGSAACPIQIFKCGVRAYGFQHHFEADRTMAVELCRESGGLLDAAGKSVDEIDKGFEQHNETFSRLANRLCLNLATYLLPAVGLRESRLETNPSWEKI